VLSQLSDNSLDLIQTGDGSGFSDVICLVSIVANVNCRLSCYILSMLRLKFFTRGRSSFHRRFTKFIVLIIVETSFARIGISVMSSAKIDPFCLLYNSAEIQRLKCVSNKCDSVPSRQWRSKLESISLQENFSMG